jgi:hypothetical protein
LANICNASASATGLECTSLMRPIRVLILRLADLLGALEEP